MTLPNMLCVSKIFKSTTDYKRTLYLTQVPGCQPEQLCSSRDNFDFLILLAVLQNLGVKRSLRNPQVQMTLSRRTMSSCFWLDLHFDWRAKLLYYWQYKLKGTTNSYKNIKILTINMVILHSFISIYTTTRPPTRAARPFNTKSPSAQP